MENEQELIENKELRDQCVEHYEVLDKVKELLLIPGTDFATIKQVSDFYEVGESNIKMLYSSHTEEFDEDGVCNKAYKDFLKSTDMTLKTGKGKSILTFSDGVILVVPNRGLKVFPRRAILRVGMLLRDSEIAKEVRTQLLNIEEKASNKVKISDITEEQSLMIAVGMAMSSGDVNALGIASTNLVAFKNRHISQLEENNSKLEEDNKLLANGILEWSDRKNLNLGVRKLAGATHIQFGSIWSELYKQLHYKYGINLKARNNGHKPYIENIKESEWNTVVKSFSAMCESYKQSPTEMLQQKVLV